MRICLFIGQLVELWLGYCLGLCTPENKKQHGCILKEEEDRHKIYIRCYHSI